MSPSSALRIVHLHSALEDADAILRDRVAVLLGIPGADVLVGRSCPRCGSSAHGRPWARPRDAREEVHVSLTRCGEHLMTAVSTEGPVGVDLESIAAVDRGWDPELMLHPSERSVGEPRGSQERGNPQEPRDPEGRAAVWARKEAVLKALGTGFGTPMSTVRLADFAVFDLPAPPGHVAAITRL